jgi:hypothetical protein
MAKVLIDEQVEELVQLLDEIQRLIDMEYRGLAQGSVLSSILARVQRMQQVLGVKYRNGR